MSAIKLPPLDVLFRDYVASLKPEVREFMQTHGDLATYRHVVTQVYAALDANPALMRQLQVARRRNAVESVDSVILEAAGRCDPDTLRFFSEPQAERLDGWDRAQIFKRD